MNVFTKITQIFLIIMAAETQLAAAETQSCPLISSNIYLIILLLFMLLMISIRYAQITKKCSLRDAEMDSLASKLEVLEADKAELTKALSELQKAAVKDKETINNLQDALKSDSFDGRVPICANCKDIRDENGFWHPIEEYLQKLSNSADFSHSLCPECAQKLYPDLFKDGNKPHTLTWK